MDSSEIRKEFGKFFMDIAKLVFAGAVLTTILKLEDVSRFIIFTCGLIGTIFLCFIAYFIFKSKK